MMFVYSIVLVLYALLFVSYGAGIVVIVVVIVGHLHGEIVLPAIIITHRISICRLRAA